MKIKTALSLGFIAMALCYTTVSLSCSGSACNSAADCNDQVCGSGGSCSGPDPFVNCSGTCNCNEP